MDEQTYDVTGMHCASCGSIVSRKLKKLPGVESCYVNFATEKATISFDRKKVDVDMMNNEINKLGYSLTPKNHSMHDMSMPGMDHSEHLGLNQSKEEKLKELQKLKTKVKFSFPITIIIFALMLWDIFSKISSLIPKQSISMEFFNAISFLLATIILFWVGRPYLEAVVRFIKYRVANMDSLVGIGTLTAYIYSTVVFLFPQIKEFLSLPEYTYFDVTIVVTGFITLGKYLEARSKLRTGEAIEKLLNLQAKTALVKRNGKEIEIPITEVVVGDIIIVKPGAKIPVDGIITEGETSIDESMISGESLPKDKHKGDFVIGATINRQGSFTFKANKVGSETMLAQIVKLVENAQGSRAKIQNLADKISSIFIPIVLVLAIISFTVWISVGSFFLGFNDALSFALLSFVGILVIACPCALGLATPTAIIVGVGKGAEKGILIKNAESLEKLHQINTLVFDKTGTVTNGKPMVTDIIVLDKTLTENKLLQIAFSLEKNSQHPLANAVSEKAKELKISPLKVTSFKENEGIGVEGVIDKESIHIRKPKESDMNISNIGVLQSEGKTVIVIENNGKSIGILAISDTIKNEAKETIEKLHKLKIKTVILTGDNKKTAEYIAKKLGIDDVRAEVLPKDKSDVIKELQKTGEKIAMVGDGINDAPALTQADIGIAMATGTDIAIESSDITLLSGDISKIPLAFKLSKSTIRTIKQNLFWAFIYNIVGIPLAAGVLYPTFGIFLNPVFAGMAMALSSVSVVGNSLLLKKVRI